MENGFGSPRTDSFPAGLRVLVVDDDPTWLKILEKMLKKCSYEVTTCCLAREALNMLRERKDWFDIVISDVNMPDMDGFKLLEHVGLEMDLPVIMMSVDGETSRVMKGVQHGACDYLLKPVRMKELKNIWQHVLRKKIHEVKEIESYECIEEVQMMRNGSNKFDDGNSFSGSRRDVEIKDHDNQDLNDPSSVKKARVLWSFDLHQKFVNAVDQIGLDKVGPKKILDLMNVPWLTRENVASHLQKYRLYLSRLQRHDEPTACFGVTKQSEFPHRDPPTCFTLQSSVPMPQTSGSSRSTGYLANNTVVQDSLDIYEGDLKNIVSVMPLQETRKALTCDPPDPRKRKSSAQISLNQSFGSVGIDFNYTSFRSTMHQQNSWSKEIPIVTFTQQIKQEHECHGHTPVLSSGPECHVQSGHLRFASSISPQTSVSERSNVSTSVNKRMCTNYRSNYVNTPTISHAIGPLPFNSETEILDMQDFGPIATIQGPSSRMKNNFDQKSTSSFEFDPQYLLCGSGSTLQSSHEALQLRSLPNYGSVGNVGLTNIEFLDYRDLDLITELPSQYYDRVKLNCEYLSDSMDYPILDQGLFIA